MKWIIAFSAVIICSYVSAADSATSEEFDILFRPSAGRHEFKLQRSKSGLFTLIFQQGLHEPVKKEIAPQLAEALSQQATDILWQTKYKSVHQGDCKTYAELKATGDRTSVCEGDTANVGATMGLLNRLRKILEY